MKFCKNAFNQKSITAFYIGEYLRDFLSYKSSIESVQNTEISKSCLLFEICWLEFYFANFLPWKLLNILKILTPLTAQQDFFATSAPFPNIYVCSDSLHSVSKSKLLSLFLKTKFIFQLLNFILRLTLQCSVCSAVVVFH